MKIYIVGEDDYDGTNIFGVYSTREKAVEALHYLDAYLKEEDIKEYELDLPNDGEKYEVFHSCHMKDGGEKEFFTTENKPSTVVPITYGYGKTPYWSGHGRTKEEAEANAEKGRLELQPVWQIHETGLETIYWHPSAIWRVDKCEGTHGFYAVHKDRNVCIIALEEYKKTGKISEFLTIY